MASTSDPRRSARGRVSLALTPAAAKFPDLDPVTLDTADLSPTDARLALAIHRTVLQRWITLEFLLARYLRQPNQLIEPALRAVLLTGAAQIVFMDRLPVHAIVDESVSLARTLVRPGAAGLVNAVLRRLALLRSCVDASPNPDSTDAPWEPAADRLPLDRGFIRLAEARLPHPTQLIAHLSIATSHPMALIQHWVDRFGAAAAMEIARHGILTPPTIVAVEPELTAGQVPVNTMEADPVWLPHAQTGFVLWTGAHQQLLDFLRTNPARRVQDPASALAVAATAALTPRLILDYCAGRGTKTRQLAQLHPHAQIIATDVDPGRLAGLRAATANLANVRVAAMGEISKVLGPRRCDLALLDVPCSNTAVLARRPEARYRFSPDSVQSLVSLQQNIVTQVAPFLAPACTILYSTCSLEPRENHEQAQWIAQRFLGRLAAEHLETPGGAGMTYHDGSYYALVETTKP